jgi:hypothetical protein
MLWWNPKTVPLCVNIWATPIFRNDLRKKISAECVDFLNPYVNFHRLCFFPETVTDTKGQERKKYGYRHMMIPFEKLKSLPEATLSLKPGITLEQLDAAASRMSDNEATAALNRARQALFQSMADG